MLKSARYVTVIMTVIITLLMVAVTVSADEEETETDETTKDCCVHYYICEHRDYTEELNTLINRTDIVVTILLIAVSIAIGVGICYIIYQLTGKFI